ncbi:uncharacterized protein [Palaemon carinicauda]|uniref:uncharacterized protein n=1 Tax=Palaemon carinicauda TaxID=392227 RepID=UPI0035B61551
MANGRWVYTQELSAQYGCDKVHSLRARSNWKLVDQVIHLTPFRHVKPGSPSLLPFHSGQLPGIRNKPKASLLRDYQVPNQPEEKSQKRQCDLQEFFKYENVSHPASLSNNGILHTCKKITAVVYYQSASAHPRDSDSDVIIIDGSGLRKLEVSYTFMRSLDVTSSLPSVRKGRNLHGKLERLAAVMYVRSGIAASVDKARLDLFVHKQRPYNSIPPTQAALRESAKHGIMWSQPTISSPTRTVLNGYENIGAEMVLLEGDAIKSLANIQEDVAVLVSKEGGGLVYWMRRRSRGQEPGGYTNVDIFALNKEWQKLFPTSFPSFFLGCGDGGKGSLTGPQFGDTESTVSVPSGKTASLPCIVHHLSDRSVTWLRRRDLHILTVGLQTYSADERFKVIHREGSDEWTLLVRYAQPRDAGIYDCQINTDPKISHPVTLNVVLDASKEVAQTKTKVFVANNTASTSDGDLRVEIQGPRELYIEEGSSLSLTCLVTSSSGPSTLVYWYHNTNLIDYNSPRGGINLKIDSGRGQTITHLLVSSVGQGDSGMYSCVPTGSHPATVRVHVNQGENEAAIQQGGLDDTSCASCPRSLFLLPLLLPCCLLFGLQDVSFKPSIAYLKTLIVSLLYKIFLPVVVSSSSDGNEVYPSSSPSLCSFHSSLAPSSSSSYSSSLFPMAGSLFTPLSGREERREVCQDPQAGQRQRRESRNLCRRS